MKLTDAQRQALTVAAPVLIAASDVLTIARGGTWQQMYTPGTTPGIIGRDLRLTATPKAITMTRPVEAVVPWAAVAEVIVAGITDEDVAALTVAYNRYATKGDWTATGLGALNALAKVVARRGLDLLGLTTSEPVQLTLDLAAAS